MLFAGLMLLVLSFPALPASAQGDEAARLRAEVAAQNERIAALLEQLVQEKRDSQRYLKTLLIYTTDQGTALEDMKRLKQGLKALPAPSKKPKTAEAKAYSALHREASSVLQRYMARTEKLTTEVEKQLKKK
jgi:hypothetical protein